MRREDPGSKTEPGAPPDEKEGKTKTQVQKPNLGHPQTRKNEKTKTQLSKPKPGARPTGEPAKADPSRSLEMTGGEAQMGEIRFIAQETLDGAEYLDCAGRPFDYAAGAFVPTKRKGRKHREERTRKRDSACCARMTGSEGESQERSFGSLRSLPSVALRASRMTMVRLRSPQVLVG